MTGDPMSRAVATPGGLVRLDAAESHRSPFESVFPTAPEVTVSELNAMVRELLEHAVPALWVTGEVSGWKRYPSGHCYFSLRDGDAQIRCVMFRSEAQRLPTDPEDGMEVRAFGTASLYERRGDFQLIVRELEGRGAGGLWKLAFDKLKSKLEAEGLLRPERKRPLPAFPATIGVVTSPVGAAFHDIVHVLSRRAPWTRVVLAATRVQGDGAAEEIAAAISRIVTAVEVDVLIVGRGGGSIEDLWAFNEEVVARAIAASPVPVISAVGHEVDVTIADLVADLRAPTPSAAAERAVPDGAVLVPAVDELALRLRAGVRRRLDREGERVDRLMERLESAGREVVRERHDAVRRLTERLEALSPLSALARGFAVPQREDGRILRRIRDFEKGARFRLRVVDGRIRCLVEGVDSNE